MKKQLAIVMACIVFITSFVCIDAFGLNGNAQSAFAIEFNGETTSSESIIRNNTYYVPLRPIFEKMGAYVFYRNRDRQILALSRDGDEIRHIIGDNKVTVNGTQRTFNNPSILENKETYVPIEMVSSVFYPCGIWYNEQQLHIRKQLLTNVFHAPIKDVLAVCKSENFYPEKFKRYIKCHASTPSYSMQDVLFRVNLGLDYPFYENVATVEQPHELRVLVNKHHQLPAGFKQYNLVNMAKEYTVNDGKQYLISRVAYDPYVQMANAAKKEGLSMKVISAYRTEDYQRNLYNNKVRTTGKVNADNYSARPGFSEHQTGLAVDISSTSGTFEYTAEFKWLQKHSYEYGFILRYPKGKEWITGYSYEPWHYRYIGPAAAKIVHDEGITYEQYYAKYVDVNEFK